MRKSPRRRAANVEGTASLRCVSGVIVEKRAEPRQLITLADNYARASDRFGEYIRRLCCRIGLANTATPVFNLLAAARRRPPAPRGSSWRAPNSPRTARSAATAPRTRLPCQLWRRVPPAPNRRSCRRSNPTRPSARASCAWRSALPPGRTSCYTACFYSLGLGLPGAFGSLAQAATTCGLTSGCFFPVAFLPCMIGS